MKLYQKDTCSLTNSKKIERKDDFISYLYSLANTIAIPALKSEWSFVKYTYTLGNMGQCWGPDFRSLLTNRFT